MSYRDIWTRTEDLESLNRRIHDGVPDEDLYGRAAGYVATARDLFLSEIPEDAEMLEIGSGVGWPIQAWLDVSPTIGRVVGLDISENMIRNAQLRLAGLLDAVLYEKKAEFKLYDGRRFPFDDSSFDVVYSFATLQHIPKDSCFFLLREAFRTVKHEGRVVLHLLSTHHIREQADDFALECERHLQNDTSVHWHFFYTFEELVSIFDEVIGVSDLDIRYVGTSAWVSFTKSGTKRPPVPHVRELLDDIDRILLANRPPVAGAVPSSDLPAAATANVHLVPGRELVRELSARLQANARRILSR